MKLIFIRHGEDYNSILPYNTHTRQWEGRTPDPPLTQTGFYQSVSLGHYLKGHSDIEVIYTSPMLRALETTWACVAAPLDVPVFVHPELFEQGGLWNYGDKDGVFTYPGYEVLRMDKKFPKFKYIGPPPDDNEGWWACRPYETLEQSEERAAKVFDYLTLTHKGQSLKVVVISHQKFINRILAHILGVPTFRFWVPLAHCSMTILDLMPSERGIRMYDYIIEGMNNVQLAARFEQVGI